MDVASLPCCPRCDHILMGITQPRCPECGTPIAPADFADLGRLVPGPPWERRRYLGRFRAFWATALLFLFQPRRALSRLQGAARTQEAVSYWLWMFPAAWVSALLLYAPIFLSRNWKWLRWEIMVDEVLAAGIRCCALILAGMFVWLPMLVLLDAALWRNRRLFHVLARGAVYSMSCWFCAAVVFAGAGNWLVDFSVHKGLDYVHAVFMPDSQWLHRLRYCGWTWGNAPIRGFFGFAPGQYVPWICWIGTLLVTLQAIAMGALTRKASRQYSQDPLRANRRFMSYLCFGWLLAVYLLLVDRHVQLRFHLQFPVEQLHSPMDWLVEQIREVL